VIVGIFCFSNKVFNKSNCSPNSVVAAPSVNTFKAKLDHYFSCIRAFK